MSWHDPIPAIYSDEVMRPLKLLFAAALLRHPDNPYGAAREIETHFGKQHVIATQWPEDQIVIDEMSRLTAILGPISKVPTKEQFAAEVYQKANSAKPGSEQLSYLQFFAKVMGYVEQPGRGDGVNIQINNQQKTMVVPVTSSEEEWERLAIEHQAKLTARHG